MTKPELIEAMARAIAYTDGWRPPYNWHQLQHEVYLVRAEAAFTAIERAGFVVVPKEPTIDMIVDATEQWLCIAAQEDRAKAIYHAMIEAGRIK